MLEEVGKRHGVTRGRFTISTRADEHERRVEQQMTITLQVESEAPVDLLVETQVLYRQAAEGLVLALKKLKALPAGEAKAVGIAVRELKTALEWVMDERTRVEKLIKQATGAVGDRALDFGAAVDEIGRRLARLRDAGSDG
jgi:hypothetical protein